MLEYGLKKLSHKYREAIILRYADLLSLEEVGQHLEITADQAKNRIHYGLRQLRTILTDVERVNQRETG